MNSSTRLVSSVVIILMSVIYGVIIAADPDVAAAIAVAYVSILLTVLLITNVWKKP